jgi:hypothetical protein
MPSAFLIDPYRVLVQGVVLIQDCSVHDCLRECEHFVYVPLQYLFIGAVLSLYLTTVTTVL